MDRAVSERRCGATTLRGTPCQRRVRKGQNRCHLHKTQHDDSSHTESRIGICYSHKTDDEVIAVVNQMDECDKLGLLSDTLEKAGFWECIDAVWESCELPRADFRVVIKPDLELFDVGAATGTDPEIVEHLIALLHRYGYEQVSIAAGLDSADLWLENRDVAVLADLVGYRYTTDDDKPYEVINLSEDTVDGEFPESSVLAESTLGRAWIDAHFRISMAKSKTHEEHFFSLSLQNLLGVLPLRDKEYHYYHRLDPGDVCVELLRRTPVHFSIIDAVVSNHGSDGIRSVNPLPTNTIIASVDLLLADFAAALKMNIDPYASPLNANALRTIGLPKRYRIEGDLTPYPDWKNVPLILSDSVRKRNSSVSVRQIVRPWFQSVNRGLFPFKNSVDERVNHFIGSFLSGADQHPMALLGLVALNYFLAASNNLMECYEIIYDKERVRRKRTSLGIDLEEYDLHDYESIVDYIEPLAQVASQTPPDHNGLRWRYMDRSVLFEFSRELPMDFHEFVSRVDISAAVRMMNDNIGGACVPVAIDDHCRITHQAERNIYLPQPNWMVIFGGSIIDVSKLEYIRYGEDCHQIFWKTVTSVNDSAMFDDGMVTFGRGVSGRTEIAVVARQQFALPLFWQVINVDFFPQMKDVLVSDAYTIFFSRTMANFEAAFEGRDVGTGRSWDAGFGEVDADDEGMPLEQLAEVFMRLAGFIAPLLSNLRNSQSASYLKKLGFGELAGEQDKQEVGNNGNAFIDAAVSMVRPFFGDLFDAVKKDLLMMRRKPEEDIL